MSNRISLMAALLVLAFSATVSGQTALNDRSSAFIRGDANQDGSVNIADAVLILDSLFGMPAAILLCEDAADANDDEQLNIADAVSLLGFLFTPGASEPPAPFPYVDRDGTGNGALGCKPVFATSAGPDTVFGTEDDVYDPAYVIGGGTGVISSDTTITNDRTWILSGLTFVDPGVTLTIEAGTTILGDPTAVPNSSLIVSRGAVPGPMPGNGRLVAVGNASQPIVFTSLRTPGNRARGDWGGVVIIGRGKTNVVSGGGEGEIEGLSGIFYGGGAGQPFVGEDSGSIAYMRVEFGGFELSTNNEINALSMFGVGSDTDINFVQVKRNLDDGFEWFGGSVDLKYGLAVGIRDDDFDYSFGWCGRGQYWVSQKADDEGDQGFECDNHETAFTNTPKTEPTICNVTLIGSFDIAGQSDIGMLFRRGAGGHVYNAIVENWQEGLQLDDAPTCDGANAVVKQLEVVTSVFQSNDTLQDVNCTLAADFPAADDFVNNASFGNSVNPAAVSVVINGTFGNGTPDFRTDAAATLPTPTDCNAIDSFFDVAPFIGAVDPNASATSAWTAQPWISYESN